MRRSILISLLPYVVGAVALVADTAQRHLAPLACVHAASAAR